ncbi:uncharacterized protein LOC107486636 [Arachis duranensis]|uniref:Uncharacterized protein LOC107486636 n=1 Tax=Arachis duranensis TaxID=130453 RepID=A0A9C6TR29_ARADU|nr:uncharacterized protein LOC107486636 [Arachis duranensis]
MTSDRSSKYTDDSTTFMKTKARLICSYSNFVINLVIFFDISLVGILTYCFNATCVVEVVRLLGDIGGDLHLHPHFEGEQREICLSTESYIQRLEAATEQSQQSGEEVSGSVTSVVDPNAIWHETASAPCKNRVYRFGLFFVSSFYTSTMRP